MMFVATSPVLAVPLCSMHVMPTRHRLPALRGETTGRNYYCMASAGVGVGEGLTTRNTEKKIKDLTLVFCRRKTKATSNTTTDATADVKNEVKNGNEILLGLKKRGFGEGKWNGFGGKLEVGETVEQAAKRELLEESGVTARELSLRGQLIFHVPSYPSTMRVHVYEAVSYEGEPTESEEMRPRWFHEESLPIKDMWADDAFWMPLFLAGKFFKGEFDFSDEQTIVAYDLKDFPSAQAIEQPAL